MRKNVVCLIGGIAAGVMIGAGVMALAAPGRVVVCDTVGAETASFAVDCDYRFDSIRYTSDNGDLILELIYKRK